MDRVLLRAKVRIGIAAPGEELYRDAPEAARLVGIGAAEYIEQPQSEPAAVEAVPPVKRKKV